MEDRKLSEEAILLSQVAIGFCLMLAEYANLMKEPSRTEVICAIMEDMQTLTINMMQQADNPMPGNYEGNA